MFEDQLEKVLETLFGDDELALEDAIVLSSRICPLQMSTNCCTYSYSSYSS